MRKTVEPTFRFSEYGLSTVNMGYGCSIEQLRAIFGKEKAKVYKLVKIGVHARS